jgi:hypothetical protein
LLPPQPPALRPPPLPLRHSVFLDESSRLHLPPHALHSAASLLPHVEPPRVEPQQHDVPLHSICAARFGDRQSPGRMIRLLFDI